MSFFARFMATLWRTCSAGLAIATVGLCAALVQHPEVEDFLAQWAFAAGLALGVGLTAVAVVGTLRFLVEGAPGSANDPLRKLARRLAPHRRAIVCLLAVGAVGCATHPLLFSRTDVRVLAASLLFAFLAIRLRHLTWFAGLRDGDAGRVRFVASRQMPDLMVLAVGAILLFCGFFLRSISPLLSAPLVLGWFAWALPLRYVTVGRDGVLVAQWRERFYPLDGKTTASAHADGMVVVTEGAKRDLSLRFAATSPAEGLFLAERIRERMSPGIAATAPPPELATSLASLDAAAGYRGAEIPRELLWRIVESPQVNARVRLRAAELVAQDAVEGEQARLQHLADDLAEPATAAALARLART